MGQHVEVLNEKISATQAEIHKLTNDLQKTKTDLGRALAEGNEQKADKLQQQRDSLVRAQERAQLRIELLNKEVPSAERLDAAGRLNEIAGEASSLAAANTAARAKYETALQALADTVNDAYAPHLRWQDLEAEARFLAEKFNLPLPSLSVVEQPDAAQIKLPYHRALALYEQRFNRSEWGTRLTELQAERKQAAFRARNANNPNRSATSFLS